MSPYVLINTLLHLMGTWANNNTEKNTVTEPFKEHNTRVLLYPTASEKKKNHNTSLDDKFPIYIFILFYADTVGINKLYWHKAQFLAMKQYLDICRHLFDRLR